MFVFFFIYLIYNFLFDKTCKRTCICQFLKIFDLVQKFWKFEEIFDFQYFLNGIQTLAKDIDKSAFILEFNDCYSQLLFYTK